jgi:hypothetical protein
MSLDFCNITTANRAVYDPTHIATPEYAMIVPNVIGFLQYLKGPTINNFLVGSIGNGVPDANLI